MTVYDNVDWHVTAAIRAGQPADHAFSHIGFLLSWLIRRELVGADTFGIEIVEAAKAGRLTTADLADVVDGSLDSSSLSLEAAAFVGSCYQAYLHEYAREFADFPDYGVPDDEKTRARADAILDRAYSDWLAKPRRQKLRGATQGPLAESTSRQDVEEARGAAPAVGRSNANNVRPTRFERPHENPDLELVIQDCLRERIGAPMSTTAREWGSSLLKGAVRRLGLSADDVFVAGAITLPPNSMSLTIYLLPNASSQRLGKEFELVIPNRPTGGWPLRVVQGLSVRWASVDVGRPDPVVMAWFSLDGFVVQVSAVAASDVENAIACIRERLAR